MKQIKVLTKRKASFVMNKKVKKIKIKRKLNQVNRETF